MRLVIVTPIFQPATGGAATYYRLLCDALLDKQIAQHITIVTEAFPGQPAVELLHDGRLQILRLFPHRAGGAMSKARQYVLYLLQNLQYMRLARLVEEAEADTVLIHSSFHNQLNLLQFALPRLRKQARLIADIRDHQLPRNNFAQLSLYARVVGCSQSVVNHLAKDPVLARLVRYIPIPQEPLRPPSTDASSAVLARCGLADAHYILFAGLIKQGKGVDLLLDAYAMLRQHMDHAPALVLVGMGKDSGLVDKANQMAGVHLLGPMCRNDLLALVHRASLVVNLSSSEGMPRICLEAMALARPVLLPRNIPEFDEHAPRFVAVSDSDPHAIAMQMHETLMCEATAPYPVERHNIDHVLGQYEELFQ